MIPDHARLPADDIRRVLEADRKGRTRPFDVIDTPVWGHGIIAEILKLQRHLNHLNR